MELGATKVDVGYGGCIMQVRSRAAVSRLIASAVVVVALGVSGCASSTGMSGIQPASAQPASAKHAVQLKAISTKRIGEGIATGAMVGAAAGGLITLLRGGNANQVVQGAFVGGMIGAAGGAIFAASVNKGAQQQADEQKRYQAVLADADANIATYKRAAATAAAVAASENTRVARLNAELRAGQISAAQYRSEIADAKDNVASLNRLIQSASYDVDDMTTMIGTTGPDPLKARKAALVEQKSSLERQRDALVEAYSRVTPDVGLKI